jgi:hypothetical protein
MAFASCPCDISILPCSDEAVAECSSISSDDDHKSACDTKIIDEKESNVSAEDIFSSSNNLFDVNQFSLLISLGVKKEFQFDALVREIVNYKGSTISFIQNNNQLGFLLLCPYLRTTEDAVLNYEERVVQSILYLQSLGKVQSAMRGKLQSVSLKHCSRKRPILQLPLHKA